MFSSKNKRNLNRKSNEMAFRLKSNHKHDSIIFDLDGTLWDASPTTAAAWSAVAANLGLELVIDEQSIKSVSGLPFDKCIEARFGDYAKKIPHLYSTLDQAEKEAIIRHGGRLYPGVTDGLKILSKEYKLLLVSNCQDWYLEAFLNHSGLRHYFQDTLCFGQTGQSKQENIQEIVKRNDLMNSIYVGDTHWDYEAAIAAGVAFEFVTYGFGSVNLDSTRRSDSFSSLTTKLSSKTKQG